MVLSTGAPTPSPEQVPRTLFSRIVAREIPSRVVFDDDVCMVVLAKRWVQPGHVLVIAREPVDDWIAAPTDLIAHLTAIARMIGRAQQVAFAPARIGLSFTGLTFPHLHAHVVPLHSHADLDLAALTDPSPEQSDDAQWRLRTALAASGIRPPALQAV